jgi:multidrug efflux pump subunit AcrB
MNRDDYTHEESNSTVTTITVITAVVGIVLGVFLITGFGGEILPKKKTKVIKYEKKEIQESEFYKNAQKMIEFQEKLKEKENEKNN